LKSRGHICGDEVNDTVAASTIRAK
jgi:hypothetical protein